MLTCRAACGCSQFVRPGPLCSFTPQSLLSEIIFKNSLAWWLAVGFSQKKLLVLSCPRRPVGGRDSLALRHSLLIPITLPIFYDNTPFTTQVSIRLGLSTPSVSCQALLNTVDIFIIFAFHFRIVLSQVTKGVL